MGQTSRRLAISSQFLDLFSGVRYCVYAASTAWFYVGVHMVFRVTITDLSDLMREKAEAREADIQAVLDGRSSLSDIHKKNAFFKNVRSWTSIDMGQDIVHLDDDDDEGLTGGVIML